MTDRGTYIKYESTKNGNPPLKILVKGDKKLMNQYSVIEINPGNCANAKNDLAVSFAKWLTGSKAQQKIKAFQLLGKPLFIPNAN